MSSLLIWPFSLIALLIALQPTVQVSANLKQFFGNELEVASKNWKRLTETSEALGACIVGCQAISGLFIRVNNGASGMAPIWGQTS